MDRRLYAAVLWLEEANQFSNVKISQIEYDETLTEASQLIGQSFPVRLSKNDSTTHPCKVLDVGKYIFIK